MGTAVIWELSYLPNCIVSFPQVEWQTTLITALHFHMICRDHWNCFLSVLICVIHFYKLGFCCSFYALKIKDLEDKWHVLKSIKICCEGECLSFFTWSGRRDFTFYWTKRRREWTWRCPRGRNSRPPPERPRGQFPEVGQLAFVRTLMQKQGAIFGGGKPLRDHALVSASEAHTTCTDVVTWYANVGSSKLEIIVSSSPHTYHCYFS